MPLAGGDGARWMVADAELGVLAGAEGEGEGTREGEGDEGFVGLRMVDWGYCVGGC